MVSNDPPQPWREALAQWRSWMHAHSKSPETTKQRLYQLRRLAHTYPDTPPYTVTTTQLVAFLDSRTWQPNTVRSMRGAFRAFYKWASDQGHMEGNPALRLDTVYVPPAKPRPTPERVIKEAQTIADERLRLMLDLAAIDGLRRGEVCKVHSRDVAEESDGYWLNVIGKGRKPRRVPLPEDLARAILRACGYVFPGNIDGHLSPAYVGKLVSRALDDGWTMHTLRHRAAGRFYVGTGGDIRAVQELLGHASVATTQIYTPVIDGSMRRAVVHAHAS